MVSSTSFPAAFKTALFAQQKEIYFTELITFLPSLYSQWRLQVWISTVTGISTAEPDSCEQHCVPWFIVRGPNLFCPIIIRFLGVFPGCSSRGSRGVQTFWRTEIKINCIFHLTSIWIDCLVKRFILWFLLSRNRMARFCKPGGMVGKSFDRRAVALKYSR